MSEILRPNPFCGHAVMRDLVADDQHRDIVCAVECDDDQIFRMGDAAWNSRPIEDALRAEVERLAEKVRRIQSACGLPNPAEACRVILAIAAEEGK